MSDQDKSETTLHADVLERILMPVMIAVDTTGESYRTAARLLLTELDHAGWRVVPKEPQNG